MPPLRIVLAEDSLLVREGVVGILRRFGHDVVAAVTDVDGLDKAVEDHAPDLTITDVRMPPTHTDEGLVAAVSLRRRYPELPILVLSQYIQPAYAAELIDTEAGGVGYLLKDRVGEIELFVSDVERVAAGGTVVDPEVVRTLLATNRSPLSRLSNRELEVLALMAEGGSNSTIAAKLIVTDAAVAKHVRSILIKLDLPPDMDGHRRVLAVLQYLQQR
ncbi:MULTISPECIES: response regulator transcription factor [Rhodococcus]|uniref:LuxR family two component transcriptional regulator n=1 Tax=Rhodococcus rhodochrous J45 TaxID=935266 RepID=A0A562ETK3_RHORH|nr:MULTISPECIES: response regulator transcription factor [Rhodococcus]MXQ75746.1 response regulator [Rhodococcus rhodochrous]OWY81401.1 DNA-binding response regulator [Rhodococcus sp. BUPNP1]TWH25098.1 LuxR family two component transcriptional regulator [Rhodococcus rhodochrous J45]